MADVLMSDYGVDLYSQGFYSYRVGWLFEAKISVQFYAVAQFKVTFNFKGVSTIAFSSNARISITHFYQSTAWFSVNTISPLQSTRLLTAKATIPFYIVSEEYMGYPWVPDVPSKGPWIPVGPDRNPNPGWTTYG